MSINPSCLFSALECREHGTKIVFQFLIAECVYGVLSHNSSSHVLILLFFVGVVGGVVDGGVGVLLCHCFSPFLYVFS